MKISLEADKKRIVQQKWLEIAWAIAVLTHSSGFRLVGNANERDVN